MNISITPGGIAALFVAPVVGSFLGLVIDRLPAGRPIVTGRSQCDQCGRPLGPASLIPLLSYILQKGRCRQCGGSLRLFYPSIELAAIVVALSVVLLMSGWLVWLSLYLGWSLLVLAMIDARHLILPDAINLPLIPIGLAAAYVIAPEHIAEHLIGTVLGFVALATIAARLPSPAQPRRARARRCQAVRCGRPPGLAGRLCRASCCLGHSPRFRSPWRAR